MPSLQGTRLRASSQGAIGQQFSFSVYGKAAPSAGLSEAGLIGGPDGPPALGAAFFTAMASQLDFDHTHPETIIQPTAPVLPPDLAALSAHNGAGRQMIEAQAGAWKPRRSA